MEDLLAALVYLFRERVCQPGSLKNRLRQSKRGLNTRGGLVNRFVKQARSDSHPPQLLAARLTVGKGPDTLNLTDCRILGVV
jgi:hypothetical protein